MAIEYVEGVDDHPPNYWDPDQLQRSGEQNQDSENDNTLAKIPDGLRSIRLCRAAQR